MTDKNIVLCGFMGCGKTTVGRLLAARLGYTFVDMDEYIEAKQGCSVTEIFNTQGEAAFRRMETKAAEELGQQSRTVIACGGGTVLQPENVAALKQNGWLFFLEVSPETVLHRLKQDTTRPLLAQNKTEAVFSLLTKRQPLYKNAADFTLSAESAPGQLVAMIEQQLQNERNKIL